MQTVEWLACLAGLLGAAVLAMNNRYSRWGFVAFLASNCLWISYGYSRQEWGLVVMQLGFTVTSIIGILRWFKTDHPKLLMIKA